MPTTTKPESNASDPSKPIVFVVTGEPIVGVAEPLARGGTPTVVSGQLRGVRIGGAVTRGATVPLHHLQAQQDEDLVVVTVGSATGEGPALRLRLHPDHARVLFQAQAGSIAARGGAAAAGGDANTVLVPLGAQWQGFEGGSGSNRGLGSDLVFKALELVGLDSRDTLARLGAIALGKRLDAQVNEGVYVLQPQTLGSLKNATPVAMLPAATGPILLMVHGTFVDTASTFGKWWSHHASLVAQLFQHYEGRVYALDHGTVMRSPIDNALTLARALPVGARLHLVTHSRGGLVAEVLLRASLGVTDADTGFFSDPAYQQHRAQLAELGALLQAKQVVVERIVRVACPAYGTLLASNRLDAYLSVLAWLLERVGVPLLPDLVRFADAVARERTDPKVLPGIEAMRASSAVVLWLNRRDGQAAPGALRVVAGDISGDSLVSWIKTLLSDSYYWTDNDLVVQTSAMYGGMLRAGEASFMLDRSGKTDHFSYFENDRSANGITQALIEDRPEGFAPIGPLSRQGQSASGARDAAAAAAAMLRPRGFGDVSRPAVVVLPGILGSNLKRGDRRQWLVWWRMFGLIDRIALPSDPNQAIPAGDVVAQDGPVEAYYKDLMEHLRDTHEVLPFGFDWRVSLSDSAAALAQTVRAALDARQGSGQPVRLLAHSMGSIVLRVMQIEHPRVWQDMMQRVGARVLMLGPPNGGSWAPMTIYTGDDNFGRFLSTVGGAFHEYAARAQMVRFVGLLQLQSGLTDPASGLGDAQQWQQMAARDLKAAQDSQTWHNTDEQVAAYKWAVPSQADLDAAISLRRKLDAQLASLAGDSDKMAIVLGQALDTPCGVSWVASGMRYLSTREGDGRVTWEAARLPGVPAWKTDHAHGDLPKVARNFAAYTELLEHGETARLDRDSSVSRGGAAAIGAALATVPAPMPRMRDSRLDAGAAPVTEADLLAAAMGSLPMAPDPVHVQAAPRGGSTMVVEVVHGDLKFSRDALLLGHSRSLELTGSEYALDKLMGGALQQALGMGLYPEATGQHQIFINQQPDANNPYAFPRPSAAIVVGLGDESELQPNMLTDSVRQAVLAYQRRVSAQPRASAGITLASTTLGSGGGLSVSQSTVALTRGVVNANVRLENARQSVDWPPVAHLRIVELYRDRAQEAWHALHVAIGSGLLSASLLPQVTTRIGGRSEPAGGNYRSAGYELVRISRKPRTGAGKVAQAELEFALYTRRARSEVRGKGMQVALVAQMVAAAESLPAYDADLARSMFQLLVPHELKAYLGTAETLMLEVDSDTAGFPWEMLDDGGGPQDDGTRPLALRLGGTVLRKMRIDTFRRQPTDAQTDDVLVIGSPRLAPAQGLSDLPGARAEAQAVAAIFGTPALLDKGFLDIVKQALARPWKVIHMAGHGLYDAKDGRSGLVMSDGVVFGPAEFESMPTVPELVFVNCCHLGKTEPATPRRHGLLAANVAEQLIRNGVRCVVAAGWAVDDAAAQAFATAFYSALREGRSFGDAVRLARQAAFIANPQSNTWAAYQCYGDPAWTLYRASGVAGPSVRRSETPTVATAHELMLALEAIRGNAVSADASYRKELGQKLTQLEALAIAQWRASGRVAEAFGLAWRDVGDRAKAIAWLDAAVAALDGTASLAAREQQLNLRVRAAGSEAQIRGYIGQIEALVALAASPERYAILGSAYKRAVIRDADEAVLLDDLAGMGDAYLRAEAFGTAELFYHLSQRCLAQLRMHWLTPGQPAPDMDDIQLLRQALASKDAQDPDFWCVVGLIEANLLEGLIRGDLAQRIDDIVAELHDVHRRVTSSNYWSSVSDTAEFLLSPYIDVAGAAADQVAAARIYLALVKSFARCI